MSRSAPHNTVQYLSVSDRSLPHALHHHRGRQAEVLSPWERLLLWQGGHAETSPLRDVQIWHRELSVRGGVWRGAGQMRVHSLLPLGGGGPPHHPQGEAILQGPLPPLHERGLRSAGGVQQDQAAGRQQDEGALPGCLRGPDQPDLHLTERSTECVSCYKELSFYCTLKSPTCISCPVPAELDKRIFNDQFNYFIFRCRYYIGWFLLN